jgi:hypothetical protein
MTKKAENAARIAEAKWQAFARKVRTLTGHVATRLKAAELRAGFDAGKTPEAVAAEIASREPVGLALHPGKAEAVRKAGEGARAYVEKVREDLIAHGWDLYAAAPYPWRLDGIAADVARYKHNEYSGLTKPDPAKGYQSRRPNNDPLIVVMDPEGVERFVQRQEETAALYYDAFIVKMVAKVGEATEAAIEGSHVWSHSFLTVTLKDGTVERWKTQEITNYSKYGLAYPQWPSRKVKD